MDVSQYKSIHRDEYRASSNTRKADQDDFAKIEQPGLDDQEKALALADYQTRIRVERANQRKKQSAIDPSSVNESHKNFTRERSNAANSMNFGSNFADGFQDQFNLINADNNYMDQNIGSGDQDEDDEMFMNQMKKAMEGGHQHRGRTQAFNNDLEGLAFGAQFKGGTDNVNKDDTLDFDDDGGFGELGADNKIVQSIHDEDDLDEEADVVGELGGADIFDTSKKDDYFDIDNRKMRNTSVNVIGSELFKGLDEIKKASEDPFSDLDDRLKEAAKQTDIDFAAGRSSTRKGSFVQKTRQALKIRKIQREIEEEKNQGIVEEGSMAGLPRLIPLRPRTNVYDQMAKSKIDQFYHGELTEEQEKEMEQKKEMQIQMARYKDVLDDQDMSNSGILENNLEQNLNTDIGQNQNNEQDSYEGFLEDFYKEMNREQHTSNNLSGDMDKKGDLFEEPIDKQRNDQSSFDFTQESTDMIKFIDWNERRHREQALAYLKKNSQLHYQGFNVDAIKQHRLTEEIQLRKISEQMMMERQFNNSKATCIALSEDLIIVGNTLGELWMYDRDTQEKYDCFKMDAKNKDFLSNAITVIEIHPVRSEYVLIGYNFGQIVLIDVTDPSKPLKIIKDHHKGSTISNMAFCEWQKQKSSKDKPIEAQDLNVTLNDPNDLANPYGRADSNIYMQKPLQQAVQANLTAWMFISIDNNGKVLVNTIQKVAFIFRTSKQTLAESRRGESKYQSLATRFKSDLHPQQKINDMVSLAAIANYERVQIYAVSQNKSQLIREITAPTFSRFEKKMSLQGCLPSLSWGYGHSPVFKDKCYASLVVGWGPLIQLFILNDVMDQAQILFDDGFVVIQNEKIRQIMEAQQMQNTSGGNSASPLKEEEKNDDSIRSQSAAIMDEINPFLQNQRFETLRQAQNIKQAARQTGIVKSPFEMPDLFIEKIFFLSESIILVLTRSLEIRIFYTQKLNHGPYNPEFKDLKKKSSALDPQIDDGLMVSNLNQSEYGQIYNQTIRAFNGMIIGLGANGLFRYIHLSWNDSLILFKNVVQGNWIQELMRAIDIYTGKLKGFRDVPEEEHMRQETMKAELKLLIRNIIIDQLQKWAQQRKEQKQDPKSSQEHLDESNVDILENLQMLDELKIDEQQQKHRTMIRIAIEFCVTIQDCQFLFYDVFLLFQEEQLEQIFLDELKPFIISGRFSDWQMPEDILQNNIINYYKDPDQPEVIEKIITNLNLKECPKSVILELIQFSEQNFLSSALLYLHTAVFDSKDDASCIHCILALLNLYSQAKEQNPGTMDEIRAIRDLSPDSIERVRAEKSHLYLGYKILWVIRLFLNGKKFPSGNIPQTRWKNYVHEIVDCISQKNIMLDLLYIDAEAYFQIISILFYKGLVFDFIKQGKLQAEKVIKAQVDLVENPLITSDVYEETMIHLSHNQLLERFDKVCQSRVDHDFLVPDSIRLQYLFFVANVASKASISKDAQYYYSCMIELLNKSQLFLNFNKQLLERAFTRKKRYGQQSIRELAPAAMIDESKHMYVSENALMELIELCEPLEDEQIDQLIEKTLYTEFYHLRVKLYEKKEDYVQCLQLIIEGMKIKEYASNKVAIERAFEWIMNILDLLEAKKSVANPESTHKEDIFRKNIMTNFQRLVKLDPVMCVELIDDKFEDMLEKYVDVLNGHNEEQYMFIDALLEMHNDKIQNIIEAYLMLGSDKDKANLYMKLQCVHLNLLCQSYPSKVKERIRCIKNNKVKLDQNRLIECLEICQENKQIEASAMLTYKMSNYMSSATEYMTLLTTKDMFDYPLLIKQISLALKFPHFVPYLHKQEKIMKKEVMRLTELGVKKPLSEQDQIQLSENDFNQSKIFRFDYIIRKVIKICNRDSTDNYSEETIDKMWFFTLDQVMKIKNDQIQMLKAIRDHKIESMDQLKEKDQKNLISGEQQPGQIQKVISEKYDRHIHNVEIFFKSRIDTIIENTLKYIELDEFLKHMVRYDENLKYEELTNMIHSIFSEKNSECVVLANANRSAKQQIISQFNSASNDYSTGILFRYRQCNICNKFLDEEVRSLKKKAEIMSHARKGTMIGHSGGAFDDDEREMAQMSIQDEDKMRLYDCGHAFHIECIKKYQRDQLFNESQSKGVVSSKPIDPKNIKITKQMLDKQRCPWCYSEKFKIDLDALFSQNQARKGGNLVNGRKQNVVGVSTKPSEGDEESKTEEDENDSEDFMDFDQDRIGSFRSGSSVMRRRRDAKFTGSMIQRGQLDIQEQRMAQYDNLFFNEGVNRQNFLIEQ